MKKIILLIGIMMALMLCITPVAAVSAKPVADDFEVGILKDEDGTIKSYVYYNMKSPDEKYIKIKTFGTTWLKSYVTIKPANIPDAPVMVVETYRKYPYIYLSQSVDEWEIKYYSCFDSFSQPDPKYLKNAGVVNLKERFRETLKYGLYLDLSVELCIYDVKGPDSLYTWYIP